MKKVKKIAIILCTFMSAIILPNHTTPVGYHTIITHFHCLKCLSESIYFLSRLQKQNYCYKPCNIIKQINCIQIDSTVFSHHKILSCLQKMIQTASLKPLLALLREVKSYRLFQDKLFFHEFFLLIFIVHKQIFITLISFTVDHSETSL